MTGKHTPGPWLADCEEVTVGKSLIAIVDPDFACPCAEETFANARLIAAAPDLLAAAHEAVRQIEYLHKMFSETDRGNATLAKLLVAIAKAEGTP